MNRNQESEPRSYISTLENSILFLKGRLHSGKLKTDEIALYQSQLKIMEERLLSENAPRINRMVGEGSTRMARNLPQNKQGK